MSDFTKLLKRRLLNTAFPKIRFGRLGRIDRWPSVVHPPPAEPPGDPGGGDPGGPAVGCNDYCVLDHGIVGDGVTDNTTALNTLVTTVLAAGGGRIYFPTGSYYFHTKPAPNKYVLRMTQYRSNVTFVGDGNYASKLFWSRTDGSGGDCHFIRLEDGASDIAFEDLYIVQGTITNPDAAEQHHLFRCAPADTSNTVGNVENIWFRRCKFGVVKGDAINLTGGFILTKCHARDIAANSASGAIPGPFVSPFRPQRVCVDFPGPTVANPGIPNWDGGYITVTGTNRDGDVISEDIHPPSSGSTDDTICGEKYFATVTGATKSALGTNSENAAIGYAYEARAVIQDCDFDGFLYGAADPGYGYRSAICAQRLSSARIQGCSFTGSDDQLVDFEPTGNGNLGDYYFGNCKFEPSGTGKFITLTGNGQSLPNRRTTFENCLFIKCGVSALKCESILFRGNYVVGPDSETDAPVAFNETQNDLVIEDNLIIVGEGSTSKGLSVEGSGGNGNSGVIIARNRIRWPGGAAGLSVASCKNIAIIDNRLEYATTTTNTNDGIVYQASVIDTDNVRIVGNIIDGSYGGGTLRWGINYQPGTVDNRNVNISMNVGTGCQTRGVSLPTPGGGGTYTNIPMLIGNQFADSSNPLNVGVGTVYAVAGNDGSWMMFKCSTDDPNGITALNGVELGCLYSGEDGNVYMKTTAGAAGWKTITHA